MPTNSPATAAAAAPASRLGTITMRTAERVGRRAADERRDVPAVVNREIGGGVSADGHEARMPDRELPCQAVDEVQADSQRDIDPDQIDDSGVVRIDLKIARAVLEYVVQSRAGPR